MLTIEFVNTSRTNDSIADYNVRVLVNGREIYRDRIIGHHRDEGWRQLVRLLVVNAPRRRKAPILCAGVGDQAVTVDGGLCCPKCGVSTLPFRNGRVRPHRVPGS